MLLNSEAKKEVFKKFGKSETDTGSAEVQVAIFTERIAHLTQHLKINSKDLATERSLVRLVGKRRRLLDFLKERDINRYRKIVKDLGLRK